MITFYKGNEKTGIIEMKEATENIWINIIDPTEKEIEIIKKLGIPLDFITYSLDLDERPRTEKEDDGTTLILIKIPLFEGDNLDVPYTTIPLGIIFNDKLVITICKRHNAILDELLRSKYKGFSIAKRIRFILRILLLTATMFLTFLRNINIHVEHVENKLQASMQNKEVMELLKYQKSLVYFETALK